MSVANLTGSDVRQIFFWRLLVWIEHLKLANYANYNIPSLPPLNWTLPVKRKKVKPFEDQKH